MEELKIAINSAKREGMTKSEILRLVVEAFPKNRKPPIIDWYSALWTINTPEKDEAQIDLDCGYSVRLVGEYKYSTAEFRGRIIETFRNSEWWSYEISKTDTKLVVRSRTFIRNKSEAEGRCEGEIRRLLKEQAKNGDKE